MGTKIEWADETWNPLTGCSAVSAGCDHCYARPMATRLAGRYGYPADEPFRPTFHPDRLDEPLRWRKPRRVFVCSMGDLFHEDVKDAEIGAVFGIMKLAAQHTFLVLTKRAKRMEDWIVDATRRFPTRWWMEDALNFRKRPELAERLVPESPWPLSNVWLGVTAENQRAADARIPVLLQIPAAVRFVSVEPMVGPVDIERAVYRSGRLAESEGWGIDWVICGGETGPGARMMNVEWARDLRDQCKAAGVPFFFKRMGDGRETPADLRVREFPGDAR